MKAAHTTNQSSYGRPIRLSELVVRMGEKTNGTQGQTQNEGDGAQRHATSSPCGGRGRSNSAPDSYWAFVSIDFAVQSAAKGTARLSIHRT